MIFLLFQVMDLLTAFVLITAQLGIIKPIILFYHASYLIVKGGWYWQDWMSWIDIAAGIYLITMIFGVTSNLSYFFAAYFLYKAATYFLMNN